MIRTIIAFLLFVSTARAEADQDWLLSWISPACCVTNSCCWQVSPTELQPLPNDEWRVLATGQIRKRTDWSPDGKFYRCACDYDTSARRWIRHQGAHTRCIFVPMRSALGTVR